MWWKGRLYIFGPCTAIELLYITTIIGTIWYHQISLVKLLYDIRFNNLTRTALTRMNKVLRKRTTMWHFYKHNNPTYIHTSLRWVRNHYHSWLLFPAYYTFPLQLKLVMIKLWVSSIPPVCKRWLTGKAEYVRRVVVAMKMAPSCWQIPHSLTPISVITNNNNIITFTSTIKHKLVVEKLSPSYIKQIINKCTRLTQCSEKRWLPSREGRRGHQVQC